MTLIELVVAMAMAIVITGASVAMMVSVLQRQPDLTQRGDQVGKARVAVEKLVQGVRQGVVGTPTLTTTSTTSKLQLETYVDGRCGTTTVSTATKCKVVYQCEAEICTRTTGTSTTSTERIAEGVRNPSTVFETLKGPSPCASVSGETITFIAVDIELKSKKGGVTLLEDGAGLRSCA